MILARMLLVVTLLVSFFAQAEEEIPWQQLYQQDWYPSDLQRYTASAEYIAHKFPGDNLDSLHYLASPERLTLAYVTAFNLRARSLTEQPGDFSLWAQLITRIGKLERAPLLQIEGLNFQAQNLLFQQKQPAQIVSLLEQAELLLNQTQQQSALQRMNATLKLQHQLLKAKLKALEGDFLSQISLMDQSLRQRNSFTTPEITIHLLYMKGLGHYYLGQNELALQALYEGLRIEKQTLAHLFLPDLNRYIGLTYLQEGNHELAIDYLQKAIELYQQKGMTKRAALSLRDIGKIYLISLLPNEALAILFNALKKEPNLSKAGEAEVSLLIAEAYTQLLDPLNTKNYLERANRLFGQTSGTVKQEGQLQTQLLQAQLLAIDATPEAIEKALAQAESVYQAALQLNSQKLLDFCTQIRIKLYSKAGLYQKANQLMAEEIQVLRRQISSDLGWRVKQVEENFQLHEVQTELSNTLSALEKSEISSNRFQGYSTWLLVLLLLSAAGALGWRFRYRQLKEELAQATTLANQNQATGLPNERMMSEYIKQEIQLLQSQHETWYTSSSNSEPPAGKLFVIMKVPMLEKVHDKYGMEGGRRLQLKLGHFLKSRFKDTAVFHIKDAHLGLVVPGHQYALASQRLLTTLQGFSPPGVGPLTNLSLGMIHYPFVGRASKAIEFNVVAELLLLAVMGATQLSEKHQCHTWVALEAIDAIPITLFNSRVRDNLLLAIDKGLIKVLTEFERADISWPQQSYNEKGQTTKDPKILLEEVE